MQRMIPCTHCQGPDWDDSLECPVCHDKQEVEAKVTKHHQDEYGHCDHCGRYDLLHVVYDNWLDESGQGQVEQTLAVCDSCNQH